MSTRDIKSILNENEHFYRFHSSSSDLFDMKWAMRNSSAHLLCEHIVVCGTLGDGMCQHEPDRMATSDHFTDALLSVASDVLVAEEDALGFWNEFGYPHELIVRKSGMDFAMSIKHKESKRQWYSMDLEKVGNKHDLQYDSRYSEVPSWADGSASSGMSIYIGTAIERTALNLYAIWHEFRYYTNSWIPEPEWVKKLEGDHDQAFMAFKRAFDYVQARKEATGYWVHGAANTRRKLEEKAAGVTA